MNQAGPEDLHGGWPMADYEEELAGERLRWRGLADLAATLKTFIDEAAAQRFANPAAETQALAQIPYYGGLWPSARALIRLLAQHRAQVAGRTVLELGCGLGLPAILAAKWGARVLATDYHPAVAALLAHNAALNGLGAHLRYQQVDWRALPDLGERFAWIIGSDILYEAAQVPTMVKMLRRHLAPGGTALITDPGRAYVQAFMSALEQDGWSVAMEVERLHQAGEQHDLFCLICQRAE